MSLETNNKRKPIELILKSGKKIRLDDIVAICNDGTEFAVQDIETDKLIELR